MKDHLVVVNVVAAAAEDMVKIKIKDKVREETQLKGAMEETTIETMAETMAETMEPMVIVETTTTTAAATPTKFTPIFTKKLTPEHVKNKPLF